MMEKNTNEKIVHEFYGNRKESTFVLDSNCGRRSLVEKHRQHEYSLKKIFMEIFLPQGYPESVTTDYLEYQAWDTAQAFCSSITGTLATEAILKGVGVGDQSATALAATLTWLLRDGSGMVGRIIFAWLKGTDLDACSKQWRLMADILNDLSFFIDFISPYFKPYFILFVCCSSCFRSIVGVAGGATRAALTQHQAVRNNLADVSAKDGSQETLVNLSALLVSLFLLPLISGRMVVAWILFVIFTFLHIFSNYRAVRCLQMRTFNRFRLKSCLDAYGSNRCVLSVKKCNNLEPVLPRLFENTGRLLYSVFKRNKSYCNVIYGASLSSMTCNKLIFEDSMNISFQDDYVIFVAQKNNNNFNINISLKYGCSAKSMFRAAFEAESLANKLRTSGYFNPSFLSESKKLTEAYFEHFWTEAAAKGWNVDYCLLNYSEYRYLSS